MSSDLHTQRHQQPPQRPSRWILLMKVIIAIGQVAAVIRQLLLRE